MLIITNSNWSTDFIKDSDILLQVNYTDATFLGIDSLQRTGDCWQDMNGTDIVLDLNYGFHLFTIVLPHLEIHGKNMSGFVRIRDNSFHMSYTLHNSSEKCLTLNYFYIEKMENVQFGASRPDYDGNNLDGFFKLVVQPSLNGIIKSNITKIEAALQPLCKIRDFEKEGIVPEFLTWFL